MALRYCRKTDLTSKELTVIDFIYGDYKIISIKLKVSIFHTKDDYKTISRNSK